MRSKADKADTFGRPRGTPMVREIHSMKVCVRSRPAGTERLLEFRVQNSDCGGHTDGRDNNNLFQ
jgi:hypothetical protein